MSEINPIEDDGRGLRCVVKAALGVIAAKGRDAGEGNHLAILVLSMCKETDAARRVVETARKRLAIAHDCGDLDYCESCMCDYAIDAAIRAYDEAVGK